MNILIYTYIFPYTYYLEKELFQIASISKIKNYKINSQNKIKCILKLKVDILLYGINKISKKSLLLKLQRHENPQIIGFF